MICEEPLTVLTVNAAAARLLKGTRYGATVADLASGLRALRASGSSRSASTSAAAASWMCGGAGRPARLASARSVPRLLAPSVTVIIPTLDRADDLDECLRAVRAVDYPADRLEIIVVDDGSADAAAIAAVAGTAWRPAPGERREPRPRLLAQPGRRRSQGRHPGLRRQRLRPRPGRGCGTSLPTSPGTRSAPSAAARSATTPSPCSTATRRSRPRSTWGAT